MSARQQRSQIVSLAEEVEDKSKLCQNYFDLIEKVGSGGKYQFMIMLIFLMTWFVIGILLLSTAFIYLNPSFDCKSFGLLVPSHCDQYVCSLPKTEWSKYVPEQQKKFISLASQFDEYYCEDSIYVDLASTLTYLGAFIGYVVISFFSDNWGRKISYVLSWGIGCVGVVILVFARHLFMGAAGLFLCGLGCDSAGNICFYIMGEVVQNRKRQKYSILIMSFFVVGALVVTGLFYLFEDWQPVCIISIAIPMFIIFFILIWYLQQTPQFLLKKDKQIALKSLNRIGMINKGQDNLITLEDIENVLAHQVAEQFHKIITPVDLLRFTSLRLTTICGCIISLATYCMYYGPALIIGEIGFDMYTSNVLINLADLATYLPAYLVIQRIPRKKSCIILFTIATITAGILIFIDKPEDCDHCLQSVIQLALIFVFRFCVSMQFAIFILYGNELYPGRARALGNGIIASAGTVGSTLCPILIGVLDRANIKLMIFFTVMGVIAIGNFTLLKETVGQTIPEEIQEIQIAKQKRKSEIIFKKSQIATIPRKKSSQIQSNSSRSMKN